MTDRYAVIGNPIEHSLSPRIHAAFAEQTGEALEYGRLLGDPERFEAQVHEFFAAGGRGLNVTVPFKERAAALARRPSDRVCLAGAANTLGVDAEGVLWAENTDGVGLVRDLTVNHHYPLVGSRVLVVGAGGAVRGVVRPLLAAAPAHLVIANRTAEKARRLAADLNDPRVSGCGLDELAGERFDLVINGTAAGLRGEVPALPADILAADGWVYDMMYGAEPTAFVRWGLAHGAARALDGLGMLVEQAAESFRLWRGVRPETRPVIHMLKREMAT